MRVDSGPAAGRQAADDAPPPRSQSWSELAGQPGCPESLRAVAQVDPSALSGAELVDAIVASEKALSLLTARQMGLLTEFARPGRAGDVSELVGELMAKGGQGRGPDGQIDLDTVETLVQERAASLAAAEVAAALQISPITAGSRVRKAQDLCESLPATADALADGRIDRGRAWLIAERTAPLSPSLREAVQDRILPIAEDRSAGNLRGLLDRAVIAADPNAAENRERTAKRDRELVLRSLPDGMACVRANAPADAAMSIFTLADLLADRTGADDDRPVAARRVDAWHDIAEQLLTHGYVDLTDLLDHPGSTDAEPVPAQRMSNGASNPAADSSDAPASDPTTDPRLHQAKDSAESREPESGERDRDESDSGAHDSDESDCGAHDTDESDTDESDSGESDSGESDSGESDSGESDSGEGDSGAQPATPIATSTADSVANAPTVNTAEPISGQLMSRSTTSSSADRAGTAGPDGVVIAHPAHPQFTPNPVLRSADGATPPAAQRLQCTTCGNHQPESMPASTIRNREDRWASRRASRQGRRPHLTVTLSASTFAGLDRLPGHLEGYGAITAETALMIARSAASITTVLLDPASGSITGSGARTYRPSQATRDIATTLATTCRFPSCRQPAWRCDLDHRDRFDHQDPDAGGTTDSANIDPLCRNHHWLKHHSAWSSTRGPDHTQIWSSPTGHRYTDPPRTLTLPGELLAPSETPPLRHPEDDGDVPNFRITAEVDDEGLRPDWRDAEFGGPFPDTTALKVRVTTVRARVERVRYLVRAPRRERSRDDRHGPVTDPPADPPAEARPVDPDEPPF